MGCDAAPALWLSPATLAPTGYARQAGEEYCTTVAVYLIQVMRFRTPLSSIGEGGTAVLAGIRRVSQPNASRNARGTQRGVQASQVC